MHILSKSKIFIFIFSIQIKIGYDSNAFKNYFKDDNEEECFSNVLIIKVKEVETKYSAQKIPSPHSGN